MKEFTYTIQDPQGMHARPAGKIAAIAQSYPGRVHSGKEKKVLM